MRETLRLDVLVGKTYSFQSKRRSARQSAQHISSVTISVDL